MNRSKIVRQKSALKRLEVAYEKFKAAGEDRKSYTSTRNGGKRKIYHPVRSYDKECARMKSEIETLKLKLSKVII